MQNSEIKICQNCKRDFIIEPEDFDFYAKMSAQGGSASGGKVPPPTFCPECRLQRRLAFFNIFTLYKRPCDLCKKDFISTYRADSPYIIYCPKCWWSDNWDVFEYGVDYDFSRPFFEQFKELWLKTPILGISVDIPTMETSPYTSHGGHIKNCYLLFHVDYNQDSAYCFSAFNSNAIFDCSNLMFCELSYDLMHAYKTAHSIGSWDLNESINCAFLRDSENCQDCFASANLKSKKYYIFNKPYSKEDYFNEIKKWDLGSYKTYQKIKKLAQEHWKKFPPKPIYEKLNTNSTGNRIYESKNCKDSFDVAGVEDSRYLMMMYQHSTKDSYDISSWGYNMSRSYECCNVGEDVSDIRFSNESGLGLMNAEYCKLSSGGKYHFGCVSIKKGDYCILNKRYSEESFDKLRARIIEHMNEMPYISKIRNSKSEIQNIEYKYGEFFPSELSPFTYNETIANKFFPITKAEALKNNYSWRDIEPHNYQITKHPKDLPDHIKNVPDEILKEVIACADCDRGFRIIRMELDFLRRMNLPLPRACPFCRIGKKFDEWVKESKLVKRICDNCGTEFESPNTEKEYPKILCKKCWLQEVV
ncbi:MAG: hypothetical protein Q7K44_03410 [Candidatus Liptonbacteria bacterium]|nr:hypothetical protein [Candidatus Liptonbacteria bacterium]